MPSLYNRVAGQSVDRLAALSDGIFAVAMTLLVLDLHIPVREAIHSERDLWRSLLFLSPRLLIFLMSVMTLGSAFCFEKQTGALLETDSPEVRPKNTVNYSCHYGVFRKFSAFWFPREVLCYEDKHLVLDAKVVELSAESSPDPDLFKPPAGVVEFPQCPSKITPPIAQSRPAPTFPFGKPGQNATVIVSVLVDADGKPQDLKIKQSGGEDFDKHALDAVSRWKFKPSTCNGEPIPAQIQVEIRFSGAP